LPALADEMSCRFAEVFEDRDLLRAFRCVKEGENDIAPLTIRVATR